MSAIFTQADASALWHAVQAFDLQVREMRKMDRFAPALVEQEGRRVKAAKAALRKVQAIRRDARRAKA